MKRIAFFLFLSFGCCACFAQISGQSGLHTISGTLIDSSTTQSLPFTAIAAFKEFGGKDSLWSTAVTGDSGEFIIPRLPAGKIKLKFSQVGYKEMVKTVNLNGDLILGKLLMNPEGTYLKEVTITGEKAQETMTVEKRVFNVSKNITTVGGTAENLLRNVPSLTIGADGTAQLRNVSTTIYVNGKPTQLTLAQIPANQIESVELMTNPSAKYDASASSGIVNLVLKKNTNQGYTGSVSAGIGNNSRFDLTLNQGLNIGKWNISGMYSVNSTKNPLTAYAHRITKAGDGSPINYFDQNTTIKLNNIFQNARLSADYSVNKSNTVSVAGNYVAGQYNSITDQQFAYRDKEGSTTSNGERITRPDNYYNNAGAELDWRHSFRRKGQTLSFTSGYTRNWVSNAADWYTASFFSNDLTGLPQTETDKINGATKGNQVIAQLDYVHPINDSTKWETGVRSFTYVRDQQYYFNKFDNEKNEYLLQPTYSQNAKITEKVNAVYVMYTTKLKHQVSVQAGMRVEQSSLTGLSRFEPESKFGYRYPAHTFQNFVKSLFPSFSLTKDLSPESQLGVSLSRKIGRPGWRQMFVGIQSNDRQNVTIGNPGLQPEFVNTAELNYNKSWRSTKLLSTLYYILEDNTIKPTVSPSAADPSVYVTTFTNVFADIRAGFDNTFTTTIFNNLSLLANFNFFNIALKTDTSSRNLWTFNAKLNLTYKFPHNFTAQLNTNNDGRFPQLQGYRGAVRAADFSLRKSFMQGRLNVLFNINDIFNSRKQYMYYDVPSAYQKSMSRREVRFYKLTVQFSLNRASVKKKEQKVARPDIDFGN